MDGLLVDPEGLSTSGDALQQLANRFSQALTACQAQLRGFNQPWGNDDIGSLIGAAHDEVSSWAFECYQTALDELGAAGADLSGMAEQHTATEGDNQGRFDTLGRRLGG